MSEDIKLLVEEYFSPRTPKFNFNMLLEMVEEAIDTNPLILKEVQESLASGKISKTILQMLPKFEISEEWGRKDTEARKEFDKWMSSLPDGPIHEKLKYIQAFIDMHDIEGYETSEILSNLMFLDLLSTVVNNFSPSGSGFLFEAFMAGLLSGRQETGKAFGTLPIEDFLNAEGEPFSLKLLAPETDIKGSIKNLLGFLAWGSGDVSGENGIEYLTVFKWGEEKTQKLSFYSFTIDPTNVYYWLSDSFKMGIKLKEGREGQAETEQEAKEIKAIQKATHAAAWAAYGRNPTGGSPGVAGRLANMKSPEGKRGAELLLKYGKETRTISSEEEINLELPPEEFEALIDPANPKAMTPEFKKILVQRQELYKRIRNNSSPAEPLGTYLSGVEFADPEKKEETRATIDGLIALYQSDKDTWFRKMMELAGLGRAIDPVMASRQAALAASETENTLTEAKEEEVEDPKTQFTIKSSMVVKRTLPKDYKKVRYGEILVDRDQIKDIAEKYAKQLEANTVEILERLDGLVVGITNYFVGKQSERGAAIESAIDSNEALKQSLAGAEAEQSVTEAVRPHLNKYDPGSLLGQVVHLLEKEGLLDAAASVREVSSVVSQAWVNKNLPPETDPRRPDPVAYLEEKKKLNPDTLLEMVEEALSVHISGQTSERNLVDAVNNVVSTGPQELNLGNLGNHVIKEARQLGGGNPEPKADIVLITESGEEIGLSMKKENFAFLESWMDAKKMMLRLQQVGMTEEESGIVVEEMRDALAMLTDQQKPVIEEERLSFIKLMEQIDPAYEFPDPVGADVMEALSRSRAFGLFNRFRNNFKIANYYAKLSDILGDKYENFLRLVVAGGEENLHPADGVLVSDVPAGITDPAVLSEHLSKTQTVEDVVQHYKTDPAINIKFRLRPITKVRTTYSKTNRGKYKVGQRMYENEELGISWTVSVVK